MNMHREIEGRERAREEWGDEGDEGHDERIEKLRDRGQLLNHSIAHAEGKYEYETRGMQDVESENDEGGQDSAGSSSDESDGREERVEEATADSDMDIESDSD